MASGRVDGTHITITSYPFGKGFTPSLPFPVAWGRGAVGNSISIILILWPLFSLAAATYRAIPANPAHLECFFGAPKLYGLDFMEFLWILMRFRSLKSLKNHAKT